MKVDLVLFTIPSCLVCGVLVEILQEVVQSEQIGRDTENVELRVKCALVPCDFAPANKVAPRMFPTLIAFVEGEAKLGWEGFAIMAPHEIQRETVLEVMNQALALVDKIKVP